MASIYGVHLLNYYTFNLSRQYMDDIYYSIIRLLNNKFTLYRHYVEYDAEFVPLSASLAKILTVRGPSIFNI